MSASLIQNINNKPIHRNFSSLAVIDTTLNENISRHNIYAVPGFMLSNIYAWFMLHLYLCMVYAAQYLCCPSYIKQYLWFILQK